MKNLRSKLTAIGAGAAALAMSSAAAAEDLLGNSATAAFTDLGDTQTSLAPLVLGIVGFTVVLGMAIRWTRKAG